MTPVGSTPVVLLPVRTNTDEPGLILSVPADLLELLRDKK